jgi:hypothetical protein
MTAETGTRVGIGVGTTTANNTVTAGAVVKGEAVVTEASTPIVGASAMGGSLAITTGRSAAAAGAAEVGELTVGTLDAHLAAQVTWSLVTVAQSA